MHRWPQNSLLATRSTVLHDPEWVRMGEEINTFITVHGSYLYTGHGASCKPVAWHGSNHKSGCSMILLLHRNLTPKASSSSFSTASASAAIAALAAAAL